MQKGKPPSHYAEIANNEPLDEIMREVFLLGPCISLIPYRSEGGFPLSIAQNGEAASCGEFKPNKLLLHKKAAGSECPDSFLDPV